jgi:hypothetical protein
MILHELRIVMNLFTALLGGRANTPHRRVVPDSGDLRIRTHSRSWDCDCYRWSVVWMHGLPAILKQAELSLRLVSGHPHPYHWTRQSEQRHLHCITASHPQRRRATRKSHPLLAAEQLVSNHFALGFGPLPSTPASRRERGHYSRHQLPSPTSSTAAEHKVVSRGPEEA